MKCSPLLPKHCCKHKLLKADFTHIKLQIHQCNHFKGYFPEYPDIPAN